jgi:hypothetical protein
MLLMMHSIEDFAALSTQAQIDYLIPLVLSLPENFAQSHIILQYIRKWSPSSDFLRSTYIQVLQYIEEGKISLQSKNKAHLEKVVSYMKAFDAIESKSKDEAESFLADSLANL